MVVGGILVGRALGNMAARKRDEIARYDLATMQEDLNDALARADAARNNADALRVEVEKRIAEVVTEERAKTKKAQQSLDAAVAQMGEAETASKNAKTTAENAEKERNVFRETLSDTEQQLVQANQRLDTLESENSSLKKSMAEADRASSKRASEKLEVVIRERDHAMRRAQELETELRKRPEGPRVTEVPRTANVSEEIERMRAEVVAANERVAISERVMEGVRARSNMLALEVKKLKASMPDSQL